MMDSSSTSSISVAKLLPTRLVKMFDRKSLMLLVMCKHKPTPGTVVDLTTAKVQDVIKMVQSGSITKETALLHLSGKLDDLLASEDKNAELQMTALTSQIQILHNLTSSVSTKSGIDGAFLFILAKISVAICTSKGVPFTICVEVEDVEHESGKAEGRATGHLHRPYTSAQMFCLLNHFQLVCSATGLASLFALAPFLDDVVYEPVRMNKIGWPVAFELLLVYLRMVENDPQNYSIDDVVAKSGSMDSKRAEALVSAEANFPSHIFRAHAGNALAGAPPPSGGKINVTGHTATAKRGCVVWNSHQTLHDPKHCKNGVCLFAHACNHWVSDKGFKGQCLQNHTSDVCNNPNKCDEPVLEPKPKKL